MKALIDSDIFQWEFGNATNDEGVPLSWPFVQSRIQGRIDAIIEATGADEYQLYLTSDDKSNFRYAVATIRPYKGNRSNIEKPRYYQQIRNFLKDHRGAIEVHGMEADDAISIAQYKTAVGEFTQSYLWVEVKDLSPRTVICSRDKDLDMVPGYHYSWGAGKQKEKGLWWQDERTGLKSFYKQVLTGDTVDNIPGLFGVGKSAQSVRNISNSNSVIDMFSICFTEYAKRYGSYAEQFLTENARLLWMLQEEGQLWEPPFTRAEVEDYTKAKQDLSEEKREEVA